MGKGILTPLGEIKIYIDNVRSDYMYKEYHKNIKPLQEQPSEECYQITVSKKDWQTICCIVSLYDTDIPNSGASGERYLYSEFVKDNIVLAIGAGDEHPAFDTNQIRYGVEYVRKTSIDKVMFGIAWETDYEGPFDIRAQLATDLY